MRMQGRPREVGVTLRNPGLTDDYAVLSRPSATHRVGGLPLLAWLCIDTVLINASFVVSYLARYPLGIGGKVTPKNWSSLGAYWQIQLWFWAFLIVLLQVEGIYRRRRQMATFDQVGVIVRSVILTGGIIAALSFVLRPPSQSRFVFLYMVVATIVSLASVRLIVRAIQIRRYRRGLDVRNVLVVGESNVAKMLLQRIAGNPGTGYRVAGFLGEREVPSDFGRFRALGTVAQVRTVLRAHRIDQVIIALPASAHEQIVRILDECKGCGAEFAIVPDMLELSLARLDLDNLGGIPLLGVRENPLLGPNLWLKRGTDVVVAGLGLFLLALPMLVAAVAIKVDSPGPVIVPQTRIGKGGRPFKFYKFRSMVQNADALLGELREQNEAGRIIFKSRQDPRRTRTGRFMRRFSFDEVPQLYNVLVGDMSLVGPRPPLAREYDLYEDWMKGRLEVTPGLTGLWQVSGRSDLIFDEMVLLDLYYIENWSPGLDLKILLQTIPALLTGRGAY
jgi:exopolysaccharide biosynthesis polyprenyl glycosylphosphotransferase